MEVLFADTNIFGIAVDPSEERRTSVWEALDAVASGNIRLESADLVLTEIHNNPHELTRKKELELYNILVSDTHVLDAEAKGLADRLEQETGLGIVDAQIVAIAIMNDCTFWSGDQRLLRDENINSINALISEEFSDLSFAHRVE